MSDLLDKIRTAVETEAFVVSNHADERLRERCVELWQLIAEIDNAELMDENPKDIPHPTVELRQSLADGTPAKVVWGWVENAGLAILITVHYFD